MTLYVGIVLLVGLSASLTGAQAAQLEITPGLDSVTRSIGQSIVFSCIATGIGDGVDPQLSWFDESNQPIDDRMGRKYIEQDGLDTLKMYISEILESDSGRYLCKGRLDGNQVEKSIQLFLFQDIAFDHAPAIQYPEIYTDALIECRVSGQPVPVVSWRYEEQRLTGTRYTTEPNGLRIRNITEADNGRYHCRAEVTADGRTKSTAIEVEVHIPPKITQQLGDSEGVEGREATISCRASGKPDAKYKFFRANSDAPMSSTDRIIVDGDQGDVHFRPLDKDDEREYICRAENDVGSDESRGYLNVIVPPRIIQLENRTALEGSAGQLLCVSEGSPPAHMTFQKPGQEPYVDGENEGGRIMVQMIRDNNLQLTINNLVPSDTSNYTCHTENEGGEFHKNGTLGVHFQPRFSPDHVTEAYSWAGKVRNISCLAMGEPEPSVRWFRYNQMLENNETYRVYLEGRHSVLQVRVHEGDQTWIYGGYICRAENQYGVTELEIFLNRATVPGSPANVEVIDRTPTTATLAVQPPEEDGGMEIVGYRVEYDSTTQDFSLGLRPEGEQIKLVNLKPTTTYVLQVRAKNEVGVGVPVEHSVTTKSMSAPYPIMVISNREGAYPFSYVLHWDNPQTGGLPIKYYDITYRPVEVREGTYEVEKPLDDYTKITVQDDQERPMRTYTLESLRPSTYYETKIVAWNEIGPSVPSRPFVFSTAAGAKPAASQLMGLSTGAIIGIVIAVFFIFLLIVDISCYFMNDCGVLMCICVHLCGKQQPGAKERAMEEGESKAVVKEQPVIEETKVPEEAAVPHLTAEEQHDDEKPPILDENEAEEEIKKGDLIEDHEERLGPDEEEETKEKLKEEINVEEETDEKTPLTDDTKAQADVPEIVEPTEVKVNEGMEDSPEMEEPEVGDELEEYAQEEPLQELPPPEETAIA